MLVPIVSNGPQLRGLDRALPSIVLVFWEDLAPVDSAMRMGVPAVVRVMPSLLAIEALPSQGAIFVLVVYPILVAPATIK
jgi:hypothetical protein